MKKAFYLLGFAMCLFSKLWAQPTLTAATTNPVVGDVFNFHYCIGSAITTTGPTGAGVTWNFAFLTQSSMDTSTYVACTSTPYCDSFPGSNIAATDGHGNYSYYTTSTGGFVYNGSEYYASRNYYTNPIDFLYYPLTYNSTHTDTGHQDYTSSGGYGTYLDTFQYDGYGTLMLPTGTYTNVVRVFEQQHLVQHLSSGTSDYGSRYYSWYVAGTHAPLLSLHYTESSGYYGLSSGYYSTKSSTLVEDINKLSGKFTLFPNPANNELTIDAANGAFDTYVITNGMGASIMHGYIDSRQTKVDISRLPQGIYYVRLAGSGNTGNSKFIKM